MKNRSIFQTAFAIVLLVTVFVLASSAQPEGAYIKGMVLSPSGSPLPAAWVIVSQGGYEKGRSLTGDDGKYYINNLSAGTYDLVVYQRDRLMFTEQINLSGDSIHHIQIR